MPAPQIMIGANGEIIIDEKSLLIESSDVAKNREVLNNSRVIDGDNLDSPYATYRRAKKYLGWSNVETLRFYKAINTIGTDFSMMVQLFPGRTRQDLKVKFKAEERRNKDLIDKAVYNPITFDLTDMLREVEMEEFEKKQNQKRLKEIEEFKQQKAETRCSKRKKKKEVLKDVRSDEDEPVYKRPKMSAKKYHDGGINSLFDSDNDDEASKDSSTVVEQPAAVADTPDLQTTIL
ncbi:PREDICTED: transcription factor TFIIIB component B'' homolog [Nicrophorus vespilloides]|uniref:Transcription factor TFIIIB component B'' homolog n=1 Tax=Nicrophorus vespilloides TaxID=110193 RepID=A0ABM1MB58_NICVS|nr:PREDICTED: transcription factor TFIIIB component B'' homolog [Nicrophorus vespilloides]